jgi:hypothetical protein
MPSSVATTTRSSSATSTRSEATLTRRESGTTHRALCLTLSKEALKQRAAIFERELIGSSDDLLVAFAEGAAASPPAEGVAATLIARLGDRPGFAVVGALDKPAVARVEELFDHLQEVSDHLRYVTYRQAEQDVHVLAERLGQRFSRACLDEAVFRPVPRGGLIVLGMLALAMGLRHDQLPASEDAGERLTVFVDDCALSGYRIHQTLEASSARRIVLAFLYAPTELCRNVESAEPRVEGCITARRLHDLGPEIFGGGYQGWVDRWTERLGRDRYWIGRPETVAFAWKEPDRSFINVATGQRETGWRIIPGALPAVRTADSRLTVHVQPSARGPLRPAGDVFFCELDGKVVIAQPENPEAIELSPTAGAFWSALIEYGTLAGAVTGLLRAYDVERSRLTADVARFVEDLVARGILETGSPPRPGADR